MCRTATHLVFFLLQPQPLNLSSQSSGVTDFQITKPGPWVLAGEQRPLCGFPACVVSASVYSLKYTGLVLCIPGSTEGKKGHFAPRSQFPFLSHSLGDKGSVVMRRGGGGVGGGRESQGNSFTSKLDHPGKAEPSSSGLKGEGS